jgi:hypothetical protein
MHFKSEETVSNCIFCDRPAGLFHNKHHDCAEKHESGRRQIANLISQAPSSSVSAGTIASQIRKVAEESFISEPESKDLLMAAWSSAVDDSLHNGILSEKTENQLVGLKNSLSLTPGDLLQTDAWDRIVKSAVLRDVMSGVIPNRMQFDGRLPLNFQKNEQVVWVFDQVDYLEEKTRREHVGGSRGVSVRVMKGVYYHIGGFKGRTIERTEMVHADTGVVAVTTKQIYFSGARKGFRIPYNKIVSFEPYTDGMGVMRDALSAKPQIFVTHDGWFTYNLVTNLARL